MKYLRNRNELKIHINNFDKSYSPKIYLLAEGGKVCMSSPI